MVCYDEQALIFGPKNLAGLYVSHAVEIESDDIVPNTFDHSAPPAF